MLARTLADAHSSAPSIQLLYETVSAQCQISTITDDVPKPETTSADRGQEEALNGENGALDDDELTIEQLMPYSVSLEPDNPVEGLTEKCVLCWDC